MFKGIILGLVVGVLLALVDYWIFGNYFPLNVLLKIPTWKRALVIYGTLIVEVLIMGFARRLYLLFPFMQNKSFDYDGCLITIGIFFAGTKILFLFIPLFKSTSPIWKK